MGTGRNDESGAILVAAMILMAVIAMFSVAALQESVTKTRTVDAIESGRRSLLAAEGALDMAVAELNRRSSLSQPVDESNDGVMGIEDWTPLSDENGNDEPDFGETGVEPRALLGCECLTYVVRLGEDGLDNDNDGEADGDSEQPYVRVVAKARVAGDTQASEVEAVVRSVAQPPHPIFSDNYAIYAGNHSGAGGYEMRFGGQSGASHSETRYTCLNCGYSRSSSFSRCPSCRRYRCKFCGAFSTYRYRCHRCQRRKWRSSPAQRTEIEVRGDDHADYVVGLIHANGDVKFTGNAEVEDLDGDGDHTSEVSATGRITGSGIRGSSFADGIAPPDIAGMDYEQIADYTISMADPPRRREWGCYGYCTTYPQSDPRHVFTDQDYRSDLGYLQNNHDNRNFFFADVREGNNDGNISISPEGNDKIYFVDGNLWVEAGAYHYRFYNPPAGGARMTIVVRGNVYMCDDFWLGYSRNPSPTDTPEPVSHYAKNGLAIIAISDGESYTDTNNNHRYDLGEPILNDNGEPGYQGACEGSGNVYYGDPNTGPVGDSQAFFYAENNFDEYCLDQRGKPLDIGIQGLMSAGNQVRMNRDFGGQHARMIVHYDGRLADGSLVLPGLPRAASGGEEPVGPWAVVSWRERAVTGPWM